jgi:hypothetical protein
MGKKTVEGVCHICGDYGPLTFEHIPPRSAFNDRPVRMTEFVKAMEQKLGGKAGGRISQRGAGYFSLCATCNNNTGTWYARSFASLTYQVADMLMMTQFARAIDFPYYLYPLRVLKQLAAMAFSLNWHEWQQYHQELVRFVLNPHQRYLPERYRFYLYLNIEGEYRSTSEAMTIFNLHTGSTMTSTELAFPPLGFVMTHMPASQVDDRLVDISYFANFEYDDFKMLHLGLHLLPTHVPIPGDYRSREQIDREALESRIKAAQLKKERLLRETLR